MGNKKYSSINDKSYSKIFVTNGTGDGIFYITDKITAIILIQCNATYYLTPKPFLRMVVSYNETIKKYGIFPYIK